jgi:hypothetical protein
MMADEGGLADHPAARHRLVQATPTTLSFRPSSLRSLDFSVRTSADSPRRLSRYEVIFALPVFVSFPHDYSVTMTVAADSAAPRIDADDALFTQLSFFRSTAADSRPYAAMVRVAEHEWGVTVHEDGPHQAFPDRITIVAATTPMVPLPGDDTHEELDDPYFVRILRLVDNIAEAYGLETGQPVPRLGPSTMFHVLLTRTIDGDGVAAAPDVSVLDTEATARRRVERLLPMSFATRTEVARTAARLDRVRVGRPYYSAVRLLASAHRAFLSREPDSAVVSATSAIESMVTEMLASVADEDGIAAPHSNTALKNLLVDHLLRRLGVPVQDPAVTAWISDGYQLRHRVVHEGAPASLAQALTALRAADDLSRRLDGALVDAVDRYPRTAARKMGRELLGRVTPTPAIRAILDEVEAGNPLRVGIVQESA